jgi:hypothetical protein
MYVKKLFAYPFNLVNAVQDSVFILEVSESILIEVALVILNLFINYYKKIKLSKYRICIKKILFCIIFIRMGLFKIFDI